MHKNKIKAFIPIRNKGKPKHGNMNPRKKAAKHFRYFVSGDVVGDIGYVPPTGLNINSKDWEKYKLMSMMSIYQPLIKLKSITA